MWKRKKTDKGKKKREEEGEGDEKREEKKEKKRGKQRTMEMKVTCIRNVETKERNQFTEGLMREEGGGEGGLWSWQTSFKTRYWTH